MEDCPSLVFWIWGETVYFDMIYAFQIQRLKLIFRPDLSDHDEQGIVTIIFTLYTQASA